MNTANHNTNRTLKLALFEGVDTTTLNTVATLVRGLPQVLRVRPDFNHGQLEVLHCRGNHSLLRDIHSILLMVNETPLTTHLN